MGPSLRAGLAVAGSLGDTDRPSLGFWVLASHKPSAEEDRGSGHQRARAFVLLPLLCLVDFNSSLHLH